MQKSTDSSLASYWMPFTANRDFKQHPRMLVSAEGMYYKDIHGKPVLDATAGLWCVPLGHRQQKIVEAVQETVATLDYSPSFQVGHPAVFEFAERLIDYSGNRFGQVFFTNSGSESVDTALKIAIGYHRARGEAGRTRLIGRERGYHGVGFGGISVGGIAGNRKGFGPLLTGVDHLPHTHDLEHNAYTRGEPEWGAHLADDLERIVALHDASTIAAVIVEPVAGSTGVLVPPKGYLKRLREICTAHGILLIFDEVITGFGRLTTPFAADYFDVEPDMITTAKGLTNGVVPMGAVFVKPHVHDAFMHGPEGIELFHGYTYSGHPLACAAACANGSPIRPWPPARRPGATCRSSWSSRPRPRTSAAWTSASRPPSGSRRWSAITWRIPFTRELGYVGTFGIRDTNACRTESLIFRDGSRALRLSMPDSAAGWTRWTALQPLP